MPNSYTKPVSANDITTAIPGKWQYAITTGGPTAFLASFPVSFTPSDGDKVTVKWNVTNTGPCTLNGKPIYKSSNGGDLPAGTLGYRSSTLIYSASADAWYLHSPWKPRFDDLPPQFAVTAGTSTAYTLDIPGFALAAGAVVAFTLHTTNGAAATLNVTSTGAIALKKFSQGGYVNLSASFLGTSQVVICVYTGLYWQVVNVLPLEAGDIPTLGTVTATGTITCQNSGGIFSDYLRAYSSSGLFIYSGQSGGRTAIGGRNGVDGTDGAANWLCADNHSSYPGSNLRFAALDTRAASTAYAIGPCYAGDIVYAELLTNEAGAKQRVQIQVESGGTVTITGDAQYVNSSSPASGEVGIYVNSNTLYRKPGSGKTTYKDAALANVGRV